MVAMRRAGKDPLKVGTVFLTHLHGDHFGGLPFLLRHAFFAKRTSPLTIAGPPTLRRRIVTALEAFFPGGSSVLDQFEVNFVELQERERTVVDGVAVTAFNALHESGAPSYSLRLEFGSKVLTYSGDTAWTPTLIEAAAGANIFVCEAYVFNKPHDNHMAFQSLMDYWPKFNCERLVLTHMSDDMLGHLAEINAWAAQDGMRLRL